eukprot:TRINITY_DN14499_c0_g1_i1.p1 TRINITY_DN14499_c0_g1~~TRINITY_DN14499_c0_g1_i1.p1  ORF type:complete len:491 (-),score=152.38 TRINITY_DN14499_c0_g1_i1:116-1588(-)
MGYDDERYDEEGEPIMDPDMQSDREISPGPVDEDWGQEQSPSPAPPSEEDAPKAKPRRRLMKKSAREGSDDDGQSHKRRGKDGMRGESLKRKNPKHDSFAKEKKMWSKSSSSKLRKLAQSSTRGDSSYNNRGDPEVKEMWDSIAGVDSEEDQEGVRTKEDDAFIDDTGVDPQDRYHSDDGAGSIGDAPQAEEGEEDDEINNLFKKGKKKNKKAQRTAEETAMLVEQFMAKLEVAAEEDAELNRQSKPAINKLKMLPMLTEVLSKKQLQEEFLDRGILSVLKNWLEPLPDGCLPNANVRSALLKILTDLPINVSLHERKEQLKKSGLGKVIMFLSKTDEETPANRRLARDLVDKWSRPIFQKSTDYGEMRRNEEDIVPYRRPQPKKTLSRSVGLESRDDDLDMVEVSNEPKPGEPGYRQHASRPEPTPMDFVVRPESKIDPDEIRARHRQLRQDERRQKMNKKLQQLKAPKKKKLQATKISVEGRGMVKYL